MKSFTAANQHGIRTHNRTIVAEESVTEDDNIPILSIISVVKADAEGLVRTWVSLCAQSYTNWEFIVIAPDGEKHRYAELLPVMPQVRVIGEERPGIYQAMNFGLRHAAGRYVIFMNAGDEFANTVSALEDAMRVMASEKYPWRAFSYTLVGQQRERQVVLSRDATLEDVAFGRMRILHQALLCKSDWLRAQFGFDESFQIAGDYDLILRGLAKEELTTDELGLARFRIGGTSTRHPRLLLQELRRAQAPFIREGKISAKSASLWAGYWNLRLGLSKFLRLLRIDLEHGLSPISWRFR